MQRHISLDVYDFTGHALCNLYDSTNDISGQATDVIISTKRNGFKEIKFSIPSTCFTEEGIVKNYRLDFLVNDYRLRFYDKDSDYTDWFLISESKVTHNEFSMQYDVRASHISQLLNTKNLSLEFSDEEGNNTGTIGQIAETILEGTGWHLNEVHFFEEEEKFNKGNVEKVRSFTSPAKTGAFKMMSDLCEMFDAKPIYHGEGTYVEDGVTKKGRTVDIVPINPFSEKFEEGTLPLDLNDNKIIELHYDKNVSNVTRTLDSDSLVSVLYAYGSYGDRNGLASLQKADHAVITFGSLTQGNYKFSYKDAQYYFTVDRTVSGLKWSSLDFTSRSYLYNGADFFKVSKNPEENVVYTKINITSEMISYEKNQVPNLLDFTYYQKIGMLTDEQLLKIAEVQSELPALHVAAEEAALDLAEAKEQLFATASDGNGFLKLDIDSSDKPYNYVRLTLKKTTYPDGVIYRSDYDETKRNYFSWTPAKGFKNSGEAIAAQGSVVYIVLPQSGSVATRWQKSYVKSIGNGTDDYYRDSLDNTYMLHVEIHKDHKDQQETGTYFPAQGVENTIYVADDTKKTYIWKDNDYVEIFASSYNYALNEFPEPTTITLWTETTYWANYSSVYLFSADAIAGLFGPKEDEVESNKKAIEKAVKVDTEVHPMYFIQYTDPVPSVDACRNGYGWYYANDQVNMNHTIGRLYFCYGKDGEDTWSRVNMYEGTYTIEGLGYQDPFNYIYSLRNFMLYRWETDSYKPFNRNTEEKAITNAFAAVVEGWNKHERLVRGVHEVYTYSDTNTPIEEGTNCAFKDPYNNYCLFTTTKDIDDPSVIRYTPGDKIVWQDDNESNIIKGMERHRRYLEFPKRNELTSFTLKGSYNSETHVITYEGASYISNNITVKPNVQYDFNLPSGFVMVCFDTNHKFVSEVTSGASYVMPNHVTQIQIITEHQIVSNHYLRVHNYDKVLFSKDVLYNIFSFTGSGERKGLFYLMKEFTRLSDSVYLTSLPALKQAQQAITDKNNELANELGDMYREGYWQENDYTEGDENKLYIDALDNLKEISHPLATYEVSYLDLNESEEINNETIVSLPYPDIDINYAAHLIDTDIDTNKWAYIDSIDKCYDKPWKTQIEINTQLSMIGQQSFTDVMAKIAEVANETKAKQTIYGKAAAIGSAGQFAADKLEGLIKANKLYILGGTSNWYTDSKGNIVFEDTDGNSAMMLTGRGLLISNSKDIYGDWEWRTALSGQGFNCDVIATGEFSAKHITAGTITTDKLSSAVGQELEIGSNKALLLYATVDGLRPVDGMFTKHPNRTDSWIKIAAQDGDNPAYIDIQSGGIVNLYGGSKMNIGSQGELNLTSAEMNLTSSEMNLTGTSININATSSLNMTSGDRMFIGNETLSTKFDNTIVETIRVYKNGTSSSTAPALASSAKVYPTFGSNDSSWTPNVQAVTSTDKYLWSRPRYKRLEGSYAYGDAVYEGELSTRVKSTHKEYLRNNSESTPPSATSSSWTTYVPVPTYNTAGQETNPYVWVCTAIVNTNSGAGEVSRTDIHRDYGLESLSGATITALNLTAGREAVKKVSSTGITIDGKYLQIGSEGEVQILGNGKVYIGSSSSNSAVVIDKNGISIGTQSNLTIASGGKLTVAASDIQLTSSLTLDDSIKNEIVETIRVYNRGTSDSEPPALSVDANTWVSSQDSNWMVIPPINGSTYKYIWSRQRKKNNRGQYYYGNATYEAHLNILKVSVTYPQFARTSTNDAPLATDDSGTWKRYVPSPTKDASGVETDPYVWRCQYVYYTNGEHARFGIQQEYGLQSLSNAAITAQNVAAGLTPVKYVDTTGIEIQNNSINIKATSSLTFAANKSLTVYNASGQNMMAFNQDGISIGSAKDIALVSGGTITIGAVGHTFDIGSNSNRAWIRNGVTYIGDNEHDGVYLGTDGIQLGKRMFSVNAAGTLTAKDGNIAGWTFDDSGRFHREVYAQGSQTVYTNGVGMCTSGGSAFYAGMTSEMTARSQSPWSVSFDGTMYAKDAYVKGQIKATSLYIGATSESDGTLLKVDTNGLVLKNSSTASTAVLNTAGIKVDSSGIVLSSTSTDSIRTIVRNSASITVDSATNLVIAASSATGQAAANKVSKIVLDSDKINISCTNVGDSNSSGIYISPTKIQAKSTGDVDFSTAKSFKIKAGSISMTAISDYTPPDISGKQDKITDVTINSSGVAISGNKYIKLDVNANNYVHINSSGIDVKGSSIKINGKDVWNHDNIIISNADPSTFTHPDNDWVLIKPYYNAEINYAGMTGNADRRNRVGQYTGPGLSFGDGSTWYRYNATLQVSNTSPYININIMIYLSNTAFNLSMDGTEATRRTEASNQCSVSFGDNSSTYHNINPQDTATLTYASGNKSVNLCSEGTNLYYYISVIANSANYDSTHVTISHSLKATTNASTSKVPCTVYYYP